MDTNEIIFKRLEKVVGYELPQSFKDFYNEHDGGYINNLPFLSLDEIINELNNMDYEYDDSEQDFKVEPTGAIKKKAYAEGRIPFMTDYSGNFVGLDFNAGTKGIVRQVINYGCDEVDVTVFANNFQDFIDGIFDLILTSNLNITDYLINNHINFRKDIDENSLPKKLELPKPKKQSITEEKIDTFEFEVQLDNNTLKDIIEILNQVFVNVKNNTNVIKCKALINDYRIKNIRDSQSRTMESPERFWKILEQVPQDEIKGYTFVAKMEIEEAIDELTSKFGVETIIFDSTSNKISVKYKSTIANEDFSNILKDICSYLETK